MNERLEIAEPRLVQVTREPDQYRVMVESLGRQVDRMHEDCTGLASALCNGLASALDDLEAAEDRVRQLETDLEGRILAFREVMDALGMPPGSTMVTENVVRAIRGLRSRA